ncbi:hypothetical protein [Micromonospora sp. NPDC047074]|uniref:WXG100 family type VII secretion target n=1 Tax=Micromonospora sp. NPDC047074 TaxID=3154339 RepID=UPI003410CD2E
MPSWEEMCQQIVVAGRPGDVTSAALGWEQLLKNVTAVKDSLEKNVTDLGEVWKGPAYESFKTHVKQIATDAGRVVDDAEKHNGIVQSLKTAADKLSAAQAEFPIPASCVNDVLEARNGRLVIDTGLFEMKVKPDFLGLLDPLTSLADWLNDKSGEAEKVYNQVSGEYTTIDSGTPGQTTPGTTKTPEVETPDLGGGPGAGPLGGAPKMGGMPNTGSPDLGGPPSIGKPDMPTTTPIGPGTHPDLDNGGYNPGDGYKPPGTGSLADDYGSGLAGAGPSTVPGLGGGGGGGLPGTSSLGGGGLGGGGGGLGGGMIPGGGSLGRPVSPNMGPMMGGAGAGGNRGGGRAGKLGAGGMGPMMGGAGAGAGGRGGGRAGAAAGAGAKGARGIGGMAGMGGGAGYGEDESARNTWLEEDEDVWGADGGGTPGILR